MAKPTASTAWRRWVERALVTISHQVQAVELKVNKLLEKAGEDKELIKLTDKLHSSQEDLQAALDAQGAEPKKTKKGKH